VAFGQLATHTLLLNVLIIGRAYISVRVGKVDIGIAFNIVRTAAIVGVSGKVDFIVVLYFKLSCTFRKYK
jgi:hypothetical protein